MSPGAMEMGDIHRRHSLERHHSDFFASLSTIGVDITELKQKHESREELLPRHDTEFTFQDSDRYAQTEQSYKPRWWDKGYLLQELWTSSWNMYLFLLVGICFAIGHHVYYRSLEKMIVYNDEQLTTLRYGTALAFAAKASLVAAVLLAFREQIWYTCSTKFLRVTTLNDMFAAPETPLSLLNLEFLWKAKIPAALVLYCWLSPLSVILTTSTLIAVPSQEVHNTTCPGVRTLNFRFEDNTNWRNGGKIASLDQQSLSWWNETSKDEFDPNFFDYYTSMSDNAKELLQASTYLQRPIFDQDNTFEVCERGWNCTVEISFVGPTYNCSTISRGVGGAEGPGFLQQENGKSMIPFNMSMLAPVGNFTYIAQTMHGEYAYPQMDAVFSGGIPKMAPPFPAHLGVFRTEPIIWIGYAEMNKSYNATEFQNRTTDVRNSAAFTPVVIACEHYEANYTAEIAYRDGMQIPTIKSKKLISPIINTTYVPELEANDGTMDKTVAVPQSNYIFPRDLKTYRRTAGYHSMGLFLRRKLNGTIQGAGLKEDSQVLYTSLIDHRFHFVRRNIIPLIEAWYGNLLMSMFARPRFQAVVWAARTDEQTGTRKTGFGPESDYLYSCTRSRPAVRYHYRTRILVSVYGILIFLALLGVTAGAVAIRRNGGVSKGTGFSNIVEATRGPTLDRMDWGEGKEYGPVKIGYGLLRTQDGDLKRPGGEILVSEPQSRRTNSRFGFGFEGDVDQLKPERRTSEEREAAVGP